MTGNGNWSKLRHERGVLVEYTTSSVPLMFVFEFNPARITRTRKLRTNLSGLDRAEGRAEVKDRSETQRIAQCVSLETESLNFTILLDATDRMNQGIDPTVAAHGVQSEIDMLNSMLEPREQVPAGMRRLAASRSDAAKTSKASPPILIFKWGPHVLPVFMTEVKIDTKDYLPNLFPYRSEATITLEIIESVSELYQLERGRQFASAQSYLASSLVNSLTDWTGI